MAPLSDLWCDWQSNRALAQRSVRIITLANSRILIVDHHETSSQFLHDQSYRGTCAARERGADPKHSNCFAPPRLI